MIKVWSDQIEAFKPAEPLPASLAKEGLEWIERFMLPAFDAATEANKTRHAARVWISIIRDALE